MRTSFKHEKRDSRNNIQFASPIQPSGAGSVLRPAAGSIPASSLALYLFDKETCRYSENHTNTNSTQSGESRPEL